MYSTNQLLVRGWGGGQIGIQTLCMCVSVWSMDGVETMSGRWHSFNSDGRSDAWPQNVHQTSIFLKSKLDELNRGTACFHKSMSIQICRKHACESHSRISMASSGQHHLLCDVPAITCPAVWPHCPISPHLCTLGSGLSHQ